MKQFVGVDVAGSTNTWVAELEDRDGRLRLREAPRKRSLRWIVDRCDEVEVAGVGIDAQLTMSIDDMTGMRSSDLALREKLGRGRENWVASINSLMAVPVRGRELAEVLSAVVGTIVETHPRACLWFAADEREERAACGRYKRGSGKSNVPRDESEQAVRVLWRMWKARFGIEGDFGGRLEDGPLDAVVCATIPFLYHRAGGEELWRLSHTQAARSGRGPFYVLKPRESRATSGESGRAVLSVAQRSGPVGGRSQDHE